MTFQRIGVIGCGLMGSGIAEVCAASGARVTVVEMSPDACEAGRARIEKSTARAEAGGKQPEGYGAGVLGRVELTTSFDALADCELVIEAATENEAAKLEIFAKLDAVVTSPDAIIASNTSSIPVTRLAMATSRPDHVIGMHFFNPVPVLKLVELVVSLRTSEATVTRAETFATEQLGKVVIRAQDRSGFVVNALLVPFILSAIRMFEAGFASAEDIDKGMVFGCAHPIGPLALADLIGLDTAKAVAESLYEEFKEPTYAAPPLLARMVEAGLLGRKSGRGFYEYS
jgi:3-hydroxybutyryl-CoA dehydrogenase